jgi:predicted MFS family arabinose efflux permease
MSLIRLAINLGWSAAPVIGGFVAISLGYHLLFWIDGLTCIAAGLYFVNISRRWKRRQKEEEEVVVEAVSEDIPPPHKNKNFLLFIIGSLLLGICFMQWFYTVPVFLKNEWGYDERYIGILLGMSALIIAIVEMPIIHSVEQKRKIRPTLLIGVFLIGISYIFFLFDASLTICFVALILWTFGEILHMPLNSSVAINMSPDSKRGGYMAWYWMAWSSTSIITPMVSLPIARAFGYDTLWIGIVIVVFVSLAIFWMIPKHKF